MRVCTEPRRIPETVTRRSTGSPPRPARRDVAPVRKGACQRPPVEVGTQCHTATETTSGSSQVRVATCPVARDRGTWPGPRTRRRSPSPWSPATSPSLMLHAPGPNGAAANHDSQPLAPETADNQTPMPHLPGRDSLPNRIAPQHEPSPPSLGRATTEGRAPLGGDGGVAPGGSQH